MVFPLQHQPEDDGREETAVCIHFALYGAEPECVAERVDEGAGQCAGLHHHELPQRLHLSAFAHQLTRQVTDAPEEEHDAGRTEERTHHVHHQSHQRRVAHKLCEQVAREHEERCPRRVTDLQLVSSGNKLGAVPEACRGLYRAAIHQRSHSKRQPPHQVVYKSKLFHLFCEFFNRCAKILNFGGINERLANYLFRGSKKTATPTVA